MKTNRDTYQRVEEEIIGEKKKIDLRELQAGQDWRRMDAGFFQQ